MAPHCEGMSHTHQYLKLLSGAFYKKQNKKQTVAATMTHTDSDPHTSVIQQSYLFSFSVHLCWMQLILWK